MPVYSCSICGRFLHSHEAKVRDGKPYCNDHAPKVGGASLADLGDGDFG